MLPRGIELAEQLVCSDLLPGQLAARLAPGRRSAPASRRARTRSARATGRAPRVRWLLDDHTSSCGQVPIRWSTRYRWKMVGRSQLRRGDERCCRPAARSGATSRRARERSRPSGAMGAAMSPARRRPRPTRSRTQSRDWESFDSHPLSIGSRLILNLAALRAHEGRDAAEGGGGEGFVEDGVFVFAAGFRGLEQVVERGQGGGFDACVAAGAQGGLEAAEVVGGGNLVIEAASGGRGPGSEPRASRRADWIAATRAGMALWPCRTRACLRSCG